MSLFHALCDMAHMRPKASICNSQITCNSPLDMLMRLAIDTSVFDRSICQKASLMSSRTHPLLSAEATSDASHSRTRGWTSGRLLA